MARFLRQALPVVLLSPAAMLLSSLANGTGGPSLQWISLAFETPDQGAIGAPVEEFRPLLEMEFEELGVDSLVFLTSDERVSLSQKEDLLNRAGPDFFVSFRFGAAAELAVPAVVAPGVTSAGIPTFPGEADALAETLAVALRTWLALDTSATPRERPQAQPSLLAAAATPAVVLELATVSHADGSFPFECREALRLLCRALKDGFGHYLGAGSIVQPVLAGFVRDAETGLPVDGVKLELAPWRETAFLEPANEGLYAFFDVQPGTCWVQVTDPRFEPVRETVVVGSSGPTWHDLRLISARPPVVEECWPSQDSSGVAVTSPLEIRFSRRMDSLSVMASLRIEPEFPWIASWSDGCRQLTIRPLRHLCFDTRYVMRIDDHARDCFGHPLDGDGNGLPGGVFETAFRTAPLDTTVLTVLEVSPMPGDTAVLPGQVISITLNRRCRAPQPLMDFVRLVDARDRMLPIAVEACEQPIDSATGANGLRLSVVPLTDLPPGEEFRLQLFPGFCDGQPDSTLSYSFRTSAARWIPWTVEDFRFPRFRWGTRRISGGPSDTASVSVAGGLGLADTVAARIAYRFESAEAVVWVTALQDSATRPIRVASGEPMTLALYGDASAIFACAVWKDLDGFEYSTATKVDWCGWSSLTFSLGDGVEPGPDGNGRADADSLDFVGLCLRAARPTSGVLYLDRITLLLRSRPSGLSWTGGKVGGAERPLDFRLEKNRPNPFRSTTEIRFWIGPSLANTPVRLEVVNLLGQTISRLWDGPASEGWHQVHWDGRDSHGADLPSGIYFARLTVAGSVAIQRLVLLR